MTKQFALDLFAGKPPRAGAGATTQIMRQRCQECQAQRVVVIALRPDDTAITFCSIDHAKLHGWPWMPSTSTRESKNEPSLAIREAAADPA